MALILNIDTATETASVCISNNKMVLAEKENAVQKEHASFIHEAIKVVVRKSGINLQSLDAVSVTSGPGSYTGLRVGLATAKGICYVINKPLITINTLEVMTSAAIKYYAGDLLFCPMIDARRMEVFTAIYDSKLKIILPPCAMILDENSFGELLEQNKILFFGSGSDKFLKCTTNQNAQAGNVRSGLKHLASLAEDAFYENRFANLAYSEPLYIKEFHSTQ